MYLSRKISSFLRFQEVLINVIGFGCHLFQNVAVAMKLSGKEGNGSQGDTVGIVSLCRRLVDVFMRLGGAYPLGVGGQYPLTVALL